MMVQKRRIGRAPSIAAASITLRGIAASPARKNRKLYEICFQVAASTTMIMAWLPLSSGFQSTPRSRRPRASTPSEGWNMKIHSTPATAGATA